MKTTTKNTFLFFIFIFITIFSIFKLLIFLMPTPSSDDVGITTYKDYGLVTKIDNCSPSRYSFYCDVETDKYLISKLLIKDFSIDTIKQGDHLSYKYISYDDIGTRILYKCKNGQCLINSKCYSWMGCWKNYQS